MIDCVPEKPKKMSKSDVVLTREEEEKRLGWYVNLPKSNHFAVGTDVICNNQRGTVINERKMSDHILKLIKWHDGGISSLRRPK